ncbi:putative adenosine monophosphate-protein transferase fic [compost metagenome]
MKSDKYGTDQAPDCYPGTDVLINLLDLHDADDLEDAERYLNEVASAQMEFVEPPYSLATLKQIHRALFSKVYSWAGEVRMVKITKGDTQFCVPEFIGPEINKEFARIAKERWFEGLPRDQLVSSVAKSYGTLNVAHPFREGNGRTQRLLFEWIISNAGYSIDWGLADTQEWVDACIHSYHVDDSCLVRIFDRCIGKPIPEDAVL